MLHKIEMSVDQQTGLFDLHSFGFGVSNLPQSTEDYVTLLSDQVGSRQNQALFSLDISGLGLPYAAYYDFKYLLQTASESQANCGTGVAGYCELPKTCDSYSKLWNYSFKIAFAQ